MCNEANLIHSTIPWFYRLAPAYTIRNRFGVCEFETPEPTRREILTQAGGSRHYGYAERLRCLTIGSDNHKARLVGVWRTYHRADYCIPSVPLDSGMEAWLWHSNGDYLEYSLEPLSQRQLWINVLVLSNPGKLRRCRDVQAAHLRIP